MADLEDPLSNYSGLSLFPQTLSSLSLSPSSNFNPNHSHSFFQSLPVRNPEKLFKEAECVLSADNTTEQFPNPDMTTVTGLNEKPVEYPRGQRPGLDRKRPRFALIPSISKPTVNFEPTLDIDKLADPDELFSAYERMENARKEITRQTGRVFTDSDRYNVFKVPRSQRPGIEGRSRPKYKHLYPTMPSQETSELYTVSDDSLLQKTAHASSQEVQPEKLASHDLEPTEASQPLELADAALDDAELTGSVAKVENRVNKLLDDLFASQGLDGDGALNLLKEKLQIKPLHIEKLNLPELQDIPQINFRTSLANLTKPRNMLLDISNLLKDAKSAIPLKLKSVDISSQSADSPTPPKSPLASLSLLKQRIFQSNSSSDPFSTADIDRLPARNSHSVENTTNHSVLSDVQKTLDMSVELNSDSREENNGVVSNMSPTNVRIDDFTILFKKPADGNSICSGSGGEIEPTETDLTLNDNNKNSSEADSDVDLQTNRLNETEGMSEDGQQEVETSAQPNQERCQSNVAASKNYPSGECRETQKTQNGAPESTEDTASEPHNDEIQEPTMAKKRRKGKQKSREGQSNKAFCRRENLSEPVMVENQTMENFPGCQNLAQENSHDTAQEHNFDTAREKNKKESSFVSMNERTRGTRKKSEVSWRQSLAGCGMSCNDGIRRSTRVKSRPLEYWKGEKFIYGRIHDSLATVIGVRYASPGKDSATLKVKAFVPDEYKNLIEQASLY